MNITSCQLCSCFVHAGILHEQLRPVRQQVVPHPDKELAHKQLRTGLLSLADAGSCAAPQGSWNPPVACCWVHRRCALSSCQRAPPVLHCRATCEHRLTNEVWKASVNPNLNSSVRWTMRGSSSCQVKGLALLLAVQRWLWLLSLCGTSCQQPARTLAVRASESSISLMGGAGCRRISAARSSAKFGAYRSSAPLPLLISERSWQQAQQAACLNARDQLKENLVSRCAPHSSKMLASTPCRTGQTSHFRAVRHHPPASGASGASDSQEIQQTTAESCAQGSQGLLSV